MQRYILAITILLIIPLILPYIAPEIIKEFIESYVFLYILIISLISLILALLVFLGAEGDRRYLMLSLATTLTMFSIGSILTYLELREVDLEFTRAYLQLMEEIASPLLLFFFIGLYFPLFIFGTWKLSKEIVFVKLRDIVLGIIFASFLLLLVVPAMSISSNSSEIQDFYTISVFFDIILLFIYIVLLLMFYRTESEVYFLMIVFFMLFWFIADNLSLAGIVHMGIPIVMYALGIVSVLSGLMYVYKKDVGVLTYSELLEEKDRLAEQYRATKEIQELMSILNRMLRHDVKNKLQIIVGYVEGYLMKREDAYLQRVIEVVEEIDKYLDKVREIDRALSVGNEALKPVNVRKVVEEVLKSYDIPVKIQGSGVALADEVLYSVIDNIVNNAIKHGKTDRLEIYIGQLEDEIEIRIVDYGVGIPQEAKKKIFEGYSLTLKEKTGLGLYIVKKVVERYGGRVWVEDTKPRGATFVIRLRTPPKK